MQNFHGQMHLLKNEVERFIQGKFRVIYTSRWKRRVQKIHTVLEDYEIISQIGASTKDEIPGIFHHRGRFRCWF